VSEGESAFARKLRERREAEARPHQHSPLEVDLSQFDDLLPDTDSAYERTEADLTIDRLIDKLDIIQAYDRWVGKPRPKQSGHKREGVMIRCPRPDHTDNNPSAWINLDKQTWYCGGCGEGGDKLDLASFHFGMGDYKNGKRFGELRERIAGEMGYTVVKAPGVTDPPVVRVASEPKSGSVVAAASPVAIPPLAPAVAAPAPAIAAGSAEPDSDTNLAKVVDLYSTESDDIILPGLEWQPLVTPQTFLDTYMQQCCVDDVPEEYHFWNGLVAISMAIGRDVRLHDYVPVLGNLFMCIVGRTGSGKSRSSRYVIELLDKALPYDPMDPMDRGVKKLATPGSAEHLISQFSRPILDPTNAKVVIGHAPVRGVVEFNELSSLLGRSGRTGSVLKPTLMEFFDGSGRITTGSLTSGTNIAVDPFATCLTSVQPKAIPKLLNQGDADSGFLNRWVFVSGTSKKRMAIGGARVDLQPCWAPIQRIHEWASDPRIIGWTDEGAAAFTKLFDERIEQLIAHDDTGLFGRIDLLCKKLCLLFTANEMLEAVTPEIVEKVEKVFEYLLAIFGVQQETLGNTDEKMCQDRIIDLIRKKAPEQKDNSLPLHYIIKLVSRKYPRKMISDSIKLLTELHIIDSYVPPARGPGRPAVVRYKLVSDAE
jgi:hypothetical protein